MFENDGEIKISVVRTGDLNSVVTVQYETSNGEAVAGHDYIYTAGKLTFSSGERVKTVTVPIIDDNEYEPDESFFIKWVLQSPASSGCLLIYLC